MASTTADRNTPAAYIQRQTYAPLAAAATVPAGVIVAVNAAGEVPTGGSSNAAGLVVVGRSEHSASYSEGDRKLVYSHGVFGFAATGALIAVAQATVGRTVYLVDNQTIGVLADAPNAIKAGKLEFIEDGRYYVSLGLGFNV